MQANQTIDFGKVVDNFYKNSTNVDFSKKNGIMLLMDTMEQMVNSEVSFAQHSESLPVAHELVHYIMENMMREGSKHKATFKQLESLMKFGIMFDVSERDYWRYVQDQMGQHLEHHSYSF